MEWVLQIDLDIIDLLEYEARVNNVWVPQEGPINPVVCTYDLTRFTGEVVVDILRTHPMVIIGGILQKNPFFLTPTNSCVNSANGESNRAASPIEERKLRKRSTLEPEASAREISDLRRCLNELVSVVALPALWTGHYPSRVTTTLLDVLVGILGP
jgi:hypothetical protein